MLLHPILEQPKDERVKVKLFLGCLVILLISSSVIAVRYYSFVFARHVHGEVVGIDRVTQPTTIIGGAGQLPSSQVFSFAVAIKEPQGEIVTASTEDRQWAVVEKGQCVEAKYFPYPPWELDKSGTYYGARLLKLYECVKGH